jgi:hypothetical protein
MSASSKPAPTSCGALAASVLEDRACARALDPPAWREPPNFFYYAGLAQRLGGWHQDWG